MQEMLEEIIQYIRGVWLKRRYILIVSWIVCPLGWLYITTLPNQYTSEARIYADTRSILQPLLRGLAIQTDPTRELELMAKTLLSRPNLETIARDIDADVRATNSQEYEAIIGDLQSNIKIQSAGRENLYTISYTGSEPGYAKDVVQATLNVFVENTLSEKRLDTDQASQIITGQIDEYEARLSEAEKKLADFKREHRGIMPGSDRGYYSQLESSRTYLEDAQLALSEAETRAESSRTQLLREEARASDQVSKVRTEYDERINSLQQRLDELLFRFTDKHPDVVETRRQLEELQSLRSKTLKSYSVSEVLANNLVYKDLKLATSQLESEVASLRVRVQRYESKIAELQDKLDKVPDVEAKLTALTRNYNITKEKYNQLLSRRESALISQSVGDSSDDIKFRIIDAPRVPSTPSGPMRPLLLSAVLVLGLGAGLGASFLVSQISPVVSSTRQLYQLVDYPVLGVVSATESSGLASWEKRKTKWFVFGNSVLVMLFVAVMAFNTIPAVQHKLLDGVTKLQGMFLL